MLIRRSFTALRSGFRPRGDARKGQGMGEFGRLAQDDSGHWYLLPENELREFMRLIDKLSDSDEDEFDVVADVINRRYAKFRLSGGPEDLRIPIS